MEDKCDNIQNCVATIEGQKTSQELSVLLAELKKLWRKEVEEKKKLEQQMIFNEENREWSQTQLNQFRQQCEQYQTALAIATEQLKAMEELKERKHQLEKEVTQSYNRYLVADDVHRQEMARLQKIIDAKDVEIKELNITIGSKDVMLSEAKDQVSKDKVKAEEDLKNLEQHYEYKISELYKEFDKSYEKYLKANDDKIIEIRANCMLSVEKIKAEYENKLARLDAKNLETTQQVTQLQLELEAWKCQNASNNANKSGQRSTSKKSAQKHKSRDSENRSRTSISLRLLESDNEDSIRTDKTNEPRSEPQPQSAPKRKKLPQNSDAYLEFLENEEI